jgi:hypothetical protein
VTLKLEHYLRNLMQLIHNFSITRKIVKRRKMKIRLDIKQVAVVQNGDKSGAVLGIVITTDDGHEAAYALTERSAPPDSVLETMQTCEWYFDNHAKYFSKFIKPVLPFLKRVEKNGD